MHRHTVHNERITSCIAHLRWRADSLSVGCKNYGSAHFRPDQLFTDATDSAPQRLGRCRDYRRVPRISAGRTGLTGQDNRALSQSALASRSQQLICHLRHFAIEVGHHTTRKRLLRLRPVGHSHGSTRLLIMLSEAIPGAASEPGAWSASKNSLSIVSTLSRLVTRLTSRLPVAHPGCIACR